MQLKGGEFQLIAADGTVVTSWRGGDGVFSADRKHYVNESECQFKISDLYETGDYAGDIHFYGGGRVGRDGYIRLSYGDTKKYISYGDKMTGVGAVTIPAGEVWINVDAGYKREAGQERITQKVAYNDAKYDLSDLAGTITKLQWPAGTSQGSFVENAGTVAGGGMDQLTAGSVAEEYQKITVDLHACYAEYVNEDGKYRWPEDGTVYTYGAPIINGESITSAYLQITSGAVTNFVSLTNGPTAEIYVKKGDYEPRVSCSFGGNIHNGGGNSGLRLFVCSYMRHVLSATAPPKEGMTIGYIPAGTYTLHQKTAADGYIPAPDQKITVKDSNQAADLQKIEIVNQKEKPHEHTFSKDWSTDENNRWHAATCEHSDVVADKAAHTYGEWNVVVKPTEEQEGLRERSCTVCGYKQQMTIEKLPAQPTKPETPHTGDNSHLGLWVAAALAAGAGLVGTVLYQRKKRS